MRNRHCTHVNQSGIVPVLEVMQNGGFVQAGELRHVLDLVKFGRIHFLYVVLCDEHTFAGLGDLHLDFVAALALDASGDEALRLVRHPHQLLLRPFRLSGRIVEAVSVHRQEAQFRIGPVYPRVQVRHLCLAHTRRGKAAAAAAVAASFLSRFPPRSFRAFSFIFLTHQTKRPSVSPRYYNKTIPFCTTRTETQSTRSRV